MKEEGGGYWEEGGGAQVESLEKERRERNEEVRGLREELESVYADKNNWKSESRALQNSKVTLPTPPHTRKRIKLRTHIHASTQPCTHTSRHPHKHLHNTQGLKSPSIHPTTNRRLRQTRHAEIDTRVCAGAERVRGTPEATRGPHRAGQPRYFRLTSFTNVRSALTFVAAGSRRGCRT